MQTKEEYYAERIMKEHGIVERECATCRNKKCTHRAENIIGCDYSKRNKMPICLIDLSIPAPTEEEILAYKKAAK